MEPAIIAVAVCGLVIGLFCRVLCLLAASLAVFLASMLLGPSGLSAGGLLAALGYLADLQIFYLIGLFLSCKKQQGMP